MYTVEMMEWKELLYWALPRQLWGPYNMSGSAVSSVYIPGCTYRPAECRAVSTHVYTILETAADAATACLIAPQKRGLDALLCSVWLSAMARKRSFFTRKDP